MPRPSIRPTSWLPRFTDALARVLRLVRPRDRTGVVALVVYSVLASALVASGPPLPPGVTLAILGLFTFLVLTLLRSMHDPGERTPGIPALVPGIVLVGVGVAVGGFASERLMNPVQEATPERAWKIEGNVLSAPTRPIPGVEVQMMGDSARSEPTDDAGYFVLYVPDEKRHAQGDSADFFVHFGSGRTGMARAPLAFPLRLLVQPQLALRRARLAAPARGSFARLASWTPPRPRPRPPREQDTTYVRIDLHTVVTEHDGTPGASAWEFMLMTNRDTLRLNRTAYEDRQGENVMLAPAFVVARVVSGERVWVEVEGRRYRFFDSRQASGRTWIDLTRLPAGQQHKFSLPVSVATTPRAGRFTFNFRVTRLPPGQRI